MSDTTIRRSDRATKGQHNSRRSSEDVSSAAKPALDKAKKGYSASGKKIGRPRKEAKKAEEVDAGDDEEEDDDDDEDDAIRCICPRTDADKDNEAFIACEDCDVWQHNDCMGFGGSDVVLPEKYYCEKCRPADHPETVEALARGEKIWETRKKALRIQRAAETRARRKSAKLGAPATTSARQSLAAEEPVPEDGAVDATRDAGVTAVDDAKPDKDASAEPAEKLQDSTRVAGVKRRRAQASSPVADAPADPVRKKSSSDVRSDKKRKSSTKPEPASEPEPVEIPQVQAGPVVFEDLPKDRQNVVTALSKTTTEGVKRRSDAGTFTLPEDSTIESFGQQLAISIEYEMFKAHGDVTSRTAYQNQFRQISPNLKSNPALLDQLLLGTLTPSKLAVMTSQEMASEEMQKRDAAMKEESEKQTILTREDADNRPSQLPASAVRNDDINKEQDEDAVVPTKGLGDVEMADQATEDTSVNDRPTSAHPTEEFKKPETRSPPEADGNAEQGKDERRASQQAFDINSVWAKTQQSPTVDQNPGRSISGPSVTPAPPAQPAQQTEDADIDRLLADDNDDTDEVYVPTGTATPQTKAVWQGPLIQPGVVETQVCGRYMAGSDFSRFVPWDQFLPRVMEIEGRLQKSTADDYLCGLEWSRKSDVSVLAITPQSGANKGKFDEIFDYFISRGRYAVGKKAHGMSEHVKDLYLAPIEANTEPPPFIERLEFCAIEFPCPERILLATFVINKPSNWTHVPVDGGADTAVVQPTNGEKKPELLGRQSLPAPAGSPLPLVQNQRSPAIDSPGQGSGVPAPQDPSHLMADPRIANLLGQHVMSPVAQQIVLAAGVNISNDQLVSMRTILDHNDAARYDMQAFQEAMVRGG